MAQFNSISHSDFVRLHEKSSITREDRFKLQSYTCYSLVDACEGLTYSDYDTIHKLEEKNLYKLMNIAGILAGVMGKDVKESLLNMPKVRYIMSTLTSNSASEKRESDKLIYLSILLHALNDFNDNFKAPPVFDGKMPQKLFQFRQLTGEQWYESAVKQVSVTAGLIYADLGLEEAFAYVCGYIAHYLNKTQPGKYGIDINVDDNTNIHNVLVKYVNSVSGNSKIISPIFSTTKYL